MKMISPLAKKLVPADKSNYTQGRKGYKICKFTPHHMAGVLTGEQCAKLFQNPKRNASANYCIGNDGSLVCSVEEENRSWASSSSWNDCQAITVEVSNSSRGGQWPISEAAWNTLVELAVDVCTRYNFRLEYTKTKNGSLTMHNMYAATACPGPYLKSKMDELARVVNDRLDNKNKKLEDDETKEDGRYHKLEDVPEWGKPTIEKLIKAGALQGDENADLNLSHDMLRIFVIDDRMGIYDK